MADVSAPSRDRARLGSKAIMAAILLVNALAIASVVLASRYDLALFLGALVLTTLAWGFVGTLLAGQLPRNPVGWLLSSAALVGAVTALMLGILSLEEAGRVSIGAARPAAWFLVAVPMPGVSALLFLAFLYFPDGRLAGRWARVGVAAAIASGMLLLLGFAGRTQTGFQEFGLVAPGWLRAIPMIDGFVGLGGIFALVAFVCAVVSVGIRYRRADPTDRRPLRWVIRLILVLAVLPLIGIVLALMLEEDWFALVIVTLIGGVVVLFALPAALLVGVLRSRLFEVELQLKRTIVVGAVVLFVVLVFVVVVVMVTTMFGVTASGIDPIGFWLGIVIALGIGPVRRWAHRGADRLLYGERATPYEVLSEFSDRLGTTYSTDDVLPRMVQLLAAGTGATEARVWIRSGRELRSVAVHPADAAAVEPVALEGDGLPTIAGATAAFPVDHGGALLGALSLTMSKADPMDASKERLARDLAAQAGLVLRNVALIEDLRDSRRRIVTAQDERARKLERDIHDGAQQQLVALSVKLRLAEQLTDRDPAKVREVLGQLQADATDALENLRDLARGIYPPLLADQGLVAALTAQARKSTVPVRVEGDGVGRLPADVEAAVYFSCLEALQNVAKYAEAGGASITLSNGEGGLRFEVADDGQGFEFASSRRGSGLQGIEDRLAALGGSLDVRSSPGEGTTIAGVIPVEVGAWTRGSR